MYTEWAKHSTQQGKNSSVFKSFIRPFARISHLHSIHRGNSDKRELGDMTRIIEQVNSRTWNGPQLSRFRNPLQSNLYRCLYVVQLPQTGANKNSLRPLSVVSKDHSVRTQILHKCHYSSWLKFIIWDVSEGHYIGTTTFLPLILKIVLLID